MAIPKSIITFVNPAFSIEKTGSILITTGSVVTISAISSGSITFTPALNNYTQIRSASLFWLDSTSLGPFYSVTGGGYFPVIDSTAFSVLFSLNSTTTIITQSNSSFYFDSASIVGSNRQFSISYLSESKYTYYDNVADEAYIQLSVDTTSNENSIVFQNGVFNSTTGEVEFTSNTPVKGGIGTSARGIGSFAMGSGSIAQESASIAEGINTLASGLASHAAGINTTASGQAAFSMGIETDADGMASFAAGSGSWARGTATVATGIGTIASASGQTVVGHYNLGLGDFNNLFVVGGGSGATTNLRKNLFRVYGGSGASTVGVEINTSETQYISSFDGFNVYGKTRFFGGVTGSAIDFNAIGVDTKTIQDPILGTITTGSFTSNFYRSQAVFGGGPLDFENVLKASVRLDHRGINFSLSEQTTAPGSTFLWTNSSNRLFYSSSAVILNDGNTLGSTMTIGTNDTNNLQLETNNTTQVFISSSGNVGIGTSSPTERLHVDGNLLVTGRITAEEFHTEFVSASIIYQSGSTQFGNSLDDTHIFTGSLSVTGSLSLKGPLYDNLGTAGTSDQILFTTSTGVEWRDNIANSAQDLVITGKNVGLTTIPKGTPLYFTGSGTAGNIVGILPADAGNPDRMPAGGVAGEQITAGSEGDVYIYGFISGVDTSAFSSGDDVFVAVGGGYTNIKPTGSALIQKLGNIEKVDPTNGSGVIQGPSWYNDLPNWEIGRVMVGRSTGQPVTSSLVYLDEANGRLGLGTTTPSASLHISGANADNLLRVGSPTNANILFVSGSGNIGIGTTNPIVKLHISQSSGIFQRVDINNANADGVNATQQYYTNTGATPDLFGATSFRLQGGTTDAFKQFQVYIANLTSPRFIINGSGNVGINTTSPTARLHISGANNGALLIVSSSAAPSALFVSGSGNVGIGTATPAYTLDVNGPFRTNNIAYVGEDFTFTSNQRRFLLEASVDGLVTYTNNTTSVANTTGFLSGEIYLDGSQPYTNHRAINTIVTCRNTSTSNILRGFYASGRTGNSGAASKVTGFTGGVNIEGSGNVTDAIALEIELFSQTNSKTITNLYGLKLGSLINSAGTITNTYGVYIDSLAAGTQTNAAFGLYQAGSDKNYFAGNVGIGETSPSARLEIRGSGATSATTALRVENSNASASLVVLDNGNVGIGTTTPSASLQVQGNFQISTGSLYTYGQNTDIDSGSIRTVMSVSTGSYRAAFFDYVLNKSTNARAGTVFSVWNGASVEWNDVSTNDIGNTAEVNLSVGLSGANVLLYASSSTNDWSVKALARML